MMDYSLETQDSTVTVSLVGRLTFNDHANFRRMIAAMAESGLPNHIINLSQLEFVDSAGLGMLLIARDELRDKGASLTLSQPSGEVKRVLTMARMGLIIPIKE